jgi:origin recognition complex subunit 1
LGTYLSINLALKPKLTPMTGPLIGRETEHTDLLKILNSAIETEVGKCIYVAGVPGTGKSETVKRVVSSIQEKHPTIFTCFLNAVECFTLPRFRKSIRSFSNRIEHQMFAILILDELDYFIAKERSCSLLYRLFDRTLKETCIIITISNTMDLPERCFSAKLHSRLGMLRVYFKPYSFKQIVSIIKAHIMCGSYGPIADDAIDYCARRIASINGDIRKVIILTDRLIRGNGGNKVNLEDMIYLMNGDSSGLKSFNDIRCHNDLLLICASKTSHQLATIYETYINFSRICGTHPAGIGYYSFLNSLKSLENQDILQLSGRCDDKHVELLLRDEEIELMLKQNPDLGSKLAFINPKQKENTDD